jgi:hypothetical protein
MTISRGQMPRQLYGLGGLLKSITKGVKSAVKGVAKTVKKNPVLGLAALNFAPMLIPGGASTFFGGKSAMFGLPGFQGAKDFFTSGSKLSQMSKVGAAGGILTGLLAQAEQGDEEAQALTRNIPALKNYLFENYKNLGYTDQQAQELTDKDTAEYTSGLGGYAEGGRIMKAYGGDTAEDNAMQASGIMGLPINENPAGVKELDLRETGGFIPPVGVKEKADDIPAMLSNNEFVFTADAVRGMGDGNVNVGAQRMYDMMKKLENGGRV